MKYIIYSPSLPICSISGKTVRPLRPLLEVWSPRKIKNLNVEEEAGNMVVDEVGPLMYNGLFIGRGGTVF
jgi:hypothetical protein